MDNETLISDMYLAAALLAYGGNLVRIDKTDPKRQQFIFSGGIKEIYMLEQNNAVKVLNQSIDDVELKYISNHLLFPPNYPDELRSIKSAVHSR